MCSKRLARPDRLAFLEMLSSLFRYCLFSQCHMVLTRATIAGKLWLPRRAGKGLLWSSLPSASECLVRSRLQLHTQDGMFVLKKQQMYLTWPQHRESFLP